ncbi:PAS domain S-box protein [Paucibacter sp. APW11]|uniref:histidine kinase n=1 Tax=Roseateles aquae TaxID=3077235 RepID=A0ABU3PE90_9BURK|nr:PAS domain S-box protein [Paucibacter sp. APW11]MDT9000833.1 PAS domain S-box protein [Paucibacter sp. APW11]
MPAIAPPPPDAALPRGRWQAALWALPLLLSLAFVAGVLAWVRANEAEERELQRQTLISDALSAEAQLRARLSDEAMQLRELAQALAGAAPGRAALAESNAVNAGLRRLWLSVTWLDARNRVLAQLPEPGALTAKEEGLSLHLVTPVGERGAEGTLVVRYSPALLLKRGVPWWLARKYDVQLVDSADQVIASSTDGPMRAAGGPERLSYRVSLPGPLRAGPLTENALSDAALELTLREPLGPTVRPLALVLMAGFVPLIGVASWLLRRQMRQVSRAEAAWRTEAAWRRAMEDSALVALRARDAEGRLLYVNRTFCDMVGLSAEALIGLRPPMPYWPPDQLEETMQRNRRNLAGHAPREGYEARWRRNDGQLLDVMVFESPLVDASGRQIGWMGSIIDITARKRLEERERRQIETLAHNARLTMLGEVASTLAHELNQPLTAIASYNAGIINSLARLGIDDAPVRGALQRLGEHAAQAGRVVQRIREFLSRREPQHERCDLHAVIRAALALMDKELRRRQIELRLRLAPTLPVVIADAVLIEQVVINLVRNAADALQQQDGARLIELSTQLVGAPEARFVRITVQDTGPGLGGRSVEALCAPFFSTKAEGMGMGLAICRSIVEAHHGVLDAQEASGGGASFSFSLPAGERAQNSEDALGES